MIKMDVSIFPKEHRSELQDILYDLAEVWRQHKKAHEDLINAYSINTPSKILDDLTFKVIELYRLQIDLVNKYMHYISKNDLIKYIR